MNKKLVKKDVDELIRVVRKYWKTGDCDILEKKHSLKKLVSINDNDNLNTISSVIEGMAQLSHFKGVTYQQIYDALHCLGYDVVD